MNNSTNELKYKVIPIGNARDLRGKKFGRLTVLDRVESVNKRTIWLVQCECGNKNTADATHLTRGNTRSCGCLRDEVATNLAQKNFEDISGETFGRLTALYPTNERSGSSVIWVCQCNCGEEARVSSGHLRMGNIRSCGCLLKENITGKNHYKYDPNLTVEDREARGRQVNKQRNWREKIYARDDYTCQVCKERGGRLNSHHLNGWDRCKDERFNVSNGITLCESCHADFHSKYGYGRNTKEQFEEYFQTIL